MQRKQLVHYFIPHSACDSLSKSGMCKKWPHFIVSVANDCMKCERIQIYVRPSLWSVNASAVASRHLVKMTELPRHESWYRRYDLSVSVTSYFSGAYLCIFIVFVTRLNDVYPLHHVYHFVYYTNARE